MNANSMFFRFCLLSALVFPCSCSVESPDGAFKGEIRDWVHEVFVGTLTTEGMNCELVLTFRQTPEDMPAEMSFAQPGKTPVLRSGVWEVGDGERVLRFSDGKEPSEYFLIKRGVRFAFQTKDGISNEDGSPVLLMRNEGLSRKESHPLRISFLDDGKAKVVGGVPENSLFGDWNLASGKIIVSVKSSGMMAVSADEIENGKEGPEETYRYFLSWPEGSSDELELEKIVVLRPFLKKDGSKRQSWMSSLIFKKQERPRLRKI